MVEKKDFIKIRVWIFIDPTKHFIYKDGVIKGNPEYIEIFYEADAKFREPIMTFINDEIGLYNWAVKFKQFDENVFEVDVYSDGDAEFYKITSIIKERIKDVEFRQFVRKGTITNYIENQ